jgi:RNA polymerase sigma-70 factor, ECF subfamily
MRREKREPAANSYQFLADAVRQEGKKVYNLAYRLCGNAEEAKDIAQETFLRTMESHRRFEGRAGIYTYLYRIVFNVWKNRLRHRARHPAISLHSSGPEGLEIDPPDPQPSPADSLEKEERLQLLKRGLASLPDRERFIIVLRDIEGRSYQEIAVILKCRFGTVKSRLARAREQLRINLLPDIKRLR